MNRITKNEEKLDEVIKTLNQLEEALNNLEAVIPKLKEVNKYYGSKNWFKDKDDYEKGKIKNIKAGVLSEDAIWNTNEKIKDLYDQMKEIINKIKKER